MTDHRYRFGYDVLGPVFAAFARLLLAKAERDGVTRLAFIARDGDFLRDVTRHLIDRLQWPSPPKLDYVHLSRVVTTLSQYDRFSDAVFAEADAIFGARRTDITALLRYFGIDSDNLRDLLERHEFLPNTEIKSAGALQPLLKDPELVTAVEAERDRQKALLAGYVEQNALLGDSSSALVDVGWRGSISTALATAFPQHVRSATLHGYLLGYWNEHGHRSVPGCDLEGLLADDRHARTPVEGAAFYAAYIIEAVCRAPHGTVIGYTRDASGTVVPLLAGDSPNRDAERAGEQWREPIRQGIHDYIEENAEHFREVIVANLRRKTQRRLFRLAFFPSESEIQAVSQLSHTEGHAPEWERRLIEPTRPSPFRSPRRWVAGLASPWRSGYVRATGGRALAVLFVALEATLLAFPSIRRGMRKIALAFAR